ncbi:hypothetical protein ABG79_02052 [Caloramator mitchellensis]|uniref:Uncharacterized protein n=1 Tax=Caloramator mitchellensis TaxID=908809 RepID=A0A0R3JRL4_CALMK|nr:hypothetical protein [Caloramator mitchellensis]KRQ86113.1 hypothetical protein ABG79_02052 [Caloramator mitchellensis]
MQEVYVFPANIYRGDFHGTGNGERIEKLKEALYLAIDSGNEELALTLSQALDEFIIDAMEEKILEKEPCFKVKLEPTSVEMKTFEKIAPTKFKIVDGKIECDKDIEKFIIMLISNIGFRRLYQIINKEAWKSILENIN